MTEERADRDSVQGDKASAGVKRTTQDLIGTVFVFKDQFMDVSCLCRVEFHRMASPFYSGDKWCVRVLRQCLNRDAEWEWEPQPSCRDAGFYARCRFDSLEEAVEAFNINAEKCRQEKEGMAR